MHYRLYFMSAHDHVMSARDIDCVDDAVAVETARSLADARTIEIWCGVRRVARVTPPVAPEPA